MPKYIQNNRISKQTINSTQKHKKPNPQVHNSLDKCGSRRHLPKDTLAEVCEPPSVTGEAVLRAIRNDRPPYGYTIWPDGTRP